MGAVVVVPSFLYHIELFIKNNVVFAHSLQ